MFFLPLPHDVSLTTVSNKILKLYQRVMSALCGIGSGTVFGSSQVLPARLPGVRAGLTDPRGELTRPEPARVTHLVGQVKDLGWLCYFSTLCYYFIGPQGDGVEVLYPHLTDFGYFLLTC